MFNLRHLSYRYPRQGKDALDDISMDFLAGECVLVTGPSGGGKSSFARILAGLIPHFYGGSVQGQLDFEGQDFLAMPWQERQQAIGYVSQNPETQIVFSDGKYELAFGMENMGLDRDTMQDRWQSIVSELALESLLSHKTSDLSQGQKQTLVIASVLVMRPRVLILDEPTSQLDPQTAENLLDLLDIYHRRHGVTLVMIEHRVQRCLRIAHRALFLDQGRLHGDMPAEDYGDWCAETYPDYVPYQTPFREIKRRPASYDVTESVSVRDLTFAYPHQAPLLQSCCFSLQQGWLHCLLGANGSGKTTILRILMGLLPLDLLEGEVVLMGRALHDIKTRDIVGDIAYLSQKPQDYLFHERVDEELLYSLARGTRDKHFRVEAMLALLGLSALKDVYPRDLSVGQQQRVALGTLLVRQPKVLLLDEPTRGLDPLCKATLGAVLCRLVDQEDTTVLMATHDEAFAEEFADRCLLLEQGQVFEDTRKYREAYAGDTCQYHSTGNAGDSGLLF